MFPGPPIYCGPGAYVLKVVGPEARVAPQTEEIIQEVRKTRALYEQEHEIVESKLAGFPAHLSVLPMSTYPGIGDWQQSVQNDGGHFLYEHLSF